jgi:hypothetical protein
MSDKTRNRLSTLAALSISALVMVIAIHLAPPPDPFAADLDRFLGQGLRGHYSRLVISPDFQQIGDPREMGEGESELVRRSGAGLRERPPFATDDICLTDIDDFAYSGPLPCESKATQKCEFGRWRLVVWDDASWEPAARSYVALYLGGKLQFAWESACNIYTTGEAPIRSGQGPKPGDDIDGDGVPDILIFTHTGGAHCCESVKHIVCSDPPVLIAQVSGYHGGVGYGDRDGDGLFEAGLGDNAFAYWNACYAASPLPEMLYRVKKGRYELAGDVMRRNAVPEEELRATVGEMRKHFSRYDEIRERMRSGENKFNAMPETDRADFSFFEDPGWFCQSDSIMLPPAVWQLMTRMIYAGQVDEAYDALDRIWPAGHGGESAFIDDLSGTILNSWHGSRLPWADKIWGRMVKYQVGADASNINGEKRP